MGRVVFCSTCMDVLNLMSNIFWEHRKVQKHVTETIRAACHVSPNTSPRYMSAMCAMKRPSAVVWGAATTGSYVSTTGAFAPSLRARGVTFVD